MLYILFTAIFLIPTFWGIGSISEKIFRINTSEGISIKILLGIIVLSVIWTATAFIFPINIYLEIFALAIGIGSFFYFKNYLELWDFISENKFLLVPGAVVILLAGSFYPFILDHFGYYVPTIKWIKEIGLVKGISNLDLLLGQMSVWHILQAGFSSFTDVFLRLNTVLLIIYLIYILEKKSWLHLVFFLVLFMFSQSPSPDLPSIVIALIILNEIISGNKNAGLLFALSVFVFAIKPTMIWVPIFTFLYVFFILNYHVKAMFWGSIILLLFVIKNIWTFGYPIFPVQFGDLGFSWKPNPEVLKISSQTAIQKTFDMQYSVSEINRFTPFDFVKNWLTLKGLKSIINTTFILSLSVFAVFAIITKNKVYNLLFISILLKSILVLCFSAQYRFFIDVFFVIAFVLLFNKINKRVALSVAVPLSILFIGFIAFPNLLRQAIPSFRPGNFMQGYNIQQIYQPSRFAWGKHQMHQIGNLKFNVVENYPYSFDIPLPAISPEFLKEYSDAKIFPQKIGEGLKDGFVWRKMTAEQQLQLKKILEEIKSHTP